MAPEQHREPVAAGLEPLESAAVRDIMWRLAGVFRTREGLSQALAVLETTCAIEQGRLASAAHDADAWRRLHLATVARLMTRAALRREESRGGHYRADFPDRDDERWRIDLVDRNG